MAARPSDATNVVVSAPKRSQELSDTTNRMLLAQSAHRHYEREQLKVGFVNGLASTTRRAQPLTELSLSERSEDSAVNRALRARIRRKLEAVKQEATQLPRLNCLGRRESVLCTNGIHSAF